MISFILAVKDYDERLEFFIESYRQFTSSIEKELVIVASVNNFIAFSERFSEKTITIVSERPNGIYSAYNKGIQIAKYDWIMFFGQDDIILPNLASIVEDPNFAEYDLIVNPVVFGDRGVLYPIKNRLGLIFRNWCHQGVIYKKAVFADRKYNQRYSIQGDHEFNIYACKKYRAKYSSVIVSYFSTEGTSQSRTDHVFKREMHSIIKENFGAIAMVLSKIRSLVGLVIRSLKE